VSVGRVVAAVVAVLIAAYVVRRRGRLSGERKFLLLLGAVVLGIYASGVLSLLPDPKKVIEDVAQALGSFTYVLVALFAFLETGAFIGLVAPGETIVIAGGVIAGQGEIELLPLIGLVWLCAMLGDTTSFFIGRRLGRGFLERHGPKVGLTHARLQQVDRYFDRHGGKTILIGRFIGLVRAVAPFIAGSSGLRYGRFLPYSVVGTGLWATAFCVLGYIFWESFNRVAEIAGRAVTAFGIVAAVVVGVVWIVRRLRDPEERRRLSAWLDRQERRPLVGWLVRLVRPVARAAVPRLRFLWRRLTPGGLGLELTTAFAVAGTGLYVFVLYTVILVGDPGPTPFDRGLLDFGTDLRTTALTDIAKLVSDLGALPTTIGLVIATAVLLVARGRTVEVIALVGGFALVYIAVQLAKAGVDRPRPEGALVDTKGSAFPSGHAAYATAWVAAAVTASEMVGLARRAALVTAGLVLTAAVGLSRIYLHAHFWSDVAGGWGLGFGLFGLCAIAALVVTYIRNNAREAA
jgi:membrane protein DedA with SNARE-associated domain/membrane-associated phospholipid phosphatase